MSQDLLVPLLFFVVIFGAALLLLLGTRGGPSSKLQQRLNVVREGIAEPGSELLVRQKHLVRLSPFERTLEELPGMERLALLAEQAGKPSAGYRVALTMLVLSAAFGVLVFAVTQRVEAAVIVAVIALGLQPLNLVMKRQQRLKQFEETLPDALDMMARALRAGNPLTECFKFAAEEMEGPISEEFSTTWQHLTYGLSLKISFDDMLARMPCTSLRAMVTAIMVQRETGGNLAEILDKIASVLRTRFRFERRLRSLTAEGRISAKVLISMPFGLALAMLITSPSYLRMLTDDPLGKRIIIVGLVLMVIGTIWIRRVVRVRF